LVRQNRTATPLRRRTNVFDSHAMTSKNQDALAPFLANQRDFSVEVSRMSVKV
jgi:hypothetical protein